jgi:hypothetical protein
MGIGRRYVDGGVGSAEYHNRDRGEALDRPDVPQELLAALAPEMPIQQDDRRERPSPGALREKMNGGLSLVLGVKSDVQFGEGQGLAKQFTFAGAVID